MFLTGARIAEELVPVLMLVPVNPRYEFGAGAPSMEILIGDDESQAENEILIALPCPLVRPYPPSVGVFLM